MKDKLINVCDRTVDNYRLAKEELRFDGDYINHFAALTYGCRNEEIPIKKVKESFNIFKRFSVETNGKIYGTTKEIGVLVVITICIQIEKKCC